MRIRAETDTDSPAVRRVNLAAFETGAEADLVDALREQARPLVSLVADDDGEIVGHIMFTPMTMADHPQTRIMGLGPMSVVPTRQRQGIGSALVRAGLSECRRLGFVAAVVLGHPALYPRFGFAPASRFGIRSDYDVPDDVFMAMELVPGALRGVAGMVRYHPAFAGV